MKLQLGMIVVDRHSGDIGMLMCFSPHKMCCSLVYVQNGPLHVHLTSRCRPATQEEIDNAGLAGVGCVSPKE